jgi:hypothetical protein
MTKTFVFSMAFFLGCILLHAQDDTTEIYPSGDSPESPVSEIFILTKRNCPLNSNESKIIFCRRLTEKWQIFGAPSEPVVTRTDRPYDQMNDLEKDYIIYKAWHTLDQNLLKKVIQIAKLDTNENFRLSSIECLSQYNSQEAKELLTGFLKEPGMVGMTSALSLVQLGENKPGFDYIKSNYSEPSVHDLFSEINTALMNIGNAEAIQLLEKFAQDPMPSVAMDAIGALSLLGKCDYAFDRFKEFAKNDNFRIRMDAANCLTYYIGKPKAMEIVWQMQYDKEWTVSEEAKRILIHFHLKKN